MDSEHEHDQQADTGNGGQETQEADKKPRHRATYASDTRNGGYMVRVVGPYPEKFAGREVPVTTRKGKTQTERLSRLIWTGPDKESGEPVALYKFEPRPRDAEQLEW